MTDKQAELPDTPVDTNAPTSPVAPKERHEIIDIIRGFALFGVLYINLLWTSQYAAGDSAPKGIFEHRAVDEFSFMFSQIFINHKFYAIFSVLFGLGFTIQLARARQRGKAILPTYAKRVGILFVIGALHALFVWSGDVLHIYALLGLMLIAFSRCSNRALLGWVGFFFVLAVGVTVMQWAVLDQQNEISGQALADAGDIQPEVIGAVEDGPYQQMTSSDYADVIAFNWNTLVTNYAKSGIGPGSNLYWYLTIFWKFLFGMYLGRTMLLQRADENIRFFKRAAIWSAVIGVLGHLSMMMSVPGFGHLLANPKTIWLGWLLVEAGIFGLSVTYVCLLVLWYQTTIGKRTLSWLAPMGRMALTNYLMHSLIFVVLFYGIGFAMLGKIGHAECLLITIGIYLGQIWMSAWWLTRFRFGPMEWLWRSLTYGRLQPLKAIR